MIELNLAFAIAISRRGEVSILYVAYSVVGVTLCHFAILRMNFKLVNLLASSLQPTLAKSRAQMSALSKSRCAV